MSTLIEITVQPSAEVTHFDTSVLLDGKRYTFAFYTSAVSDGWAFDVANDDETAVVRGVAIANGVDLLYPYRHLDLPAGPLWVHDLDLDGADPDVEAFADGRAALYYLEGA